MSAQFKPGDRVLVSAKVVEVSEDASTVVLNVEGMRIRYFLEAVHPLPTPASHLRAAAEIFVSDTGMADRYVSDGNLISTHLLQYADRLEAAAAPKPEPTLREAAQAVSDFYEKMDWDDRSREMADKVRPLWDALDEALAREVAQS